ncbi:hypothetical protein Tco_0324952, partial [Tanacetum coccineum]
VELTIHNQISLQGASNGYCPPLVSPIEHRREVWPNKFNWDCWYLYIILSLVIAVMYLSRSSKYTGNYVLKHTLSAYFYLMKPYLAPRGKTLEIAWASNPWKSYLMEVGQILCVGEIRSDGDREDQRVEVLSLEPTAVWLRDQP